MINEFDHVRIKANGIAGEVIEIYRDGVTKVFIVESDEKGVPEGYGDDSSWKLFWCSEEQLEKI